MFTQMRVIYSTQRMHAAGRRNRGENAPMIRTRDVLEYATVNGARDNGLLDTVGTLSPGKAADIVAIRAEDINNLPLNNAVGTVVLGADARNVDTVLVGARSASGAASSSGRTSPGFDASRASLATSSPSAPGSRSTCSGRRRGDPPARRRPEGARSPRLGGSPARP